MHWSWKLAEVAGIEVKVHATFLLLLLWIGGAAWAEQGSPLAALGGVAFACVLFGIVVLHELGHATAARHYGIRTRDITLLPIGGVARLERMPKEPRAELVVALAGPAVNLVLALALAATMLALGQSLAPPDPTVASGSLLARLLWVNVALLLFNLLPAFPMDGGRVLRALLAMRTDHARATRIAARLGQGLALVIGFAGLFGSPLLVFIALFVWLGAQSESAAEQMHDMMAGLHVDDAMVRVFDVLTPGDSLATASAHLLRGFQAHFPVVDGDRVAGLLTYDGLVRGLTEHAPGTCIDAVMSPVPLRVSPRDPLEHAFERMAEHQLRVAPVVDGTQLVGLLTLEGLGELVTLRSAIARRAAHGRGRAPRMAPT
ncbi:MAG: site-2 protease family protein [Deltaproteobacteria bacterium]|nr:site-2 protease family protein [Deltaproteobacteria bacterium]MBK8239512.1 site-2 protease family protein [Deltaproteobacteria bacterium]MBK8719312.1 site-2 protease family protein [Deltaproteobacteria bacterium]MBP7290008.1 site-2 protease family protein [Nannocystaceae bacterium]